MRKPPRAPARHCAVCGDLVPSTRVNGDVVYCEVHSDERRRLRGRDKGHKRRARKYGVRYERVNRKAIFERDGWMCGLCNGTVDRSLEYPHPFSVSLDHVVPISMGGSHVAGNLQCAHLHCNILKSNRVAGEVS